MADKQVLVDDLLETTGLSEDEQEALREEANARRREIEETYDLLAHAIQCKFDDRSKRRRTKEQQWLTSAGLYFGKLGGGDGVLTAETPFDPTKTSDRPDVNICRSKCSIAIANSVSMQFGTSNKNWDLLPAKSYGTPDNIAACQSMSDEIEEQLDSAKYPMHARRAMWDRVVLGTGILKGPMSVGSMVRSYEQLSGSETWIPSVTVDHTPKVVRVNPWFFYPDEGCDPTQAIPDSIEVHPMSPLELKKYMDHPGFRKEAIAKVLEEAPPEYNSDTWTNYAKVSDSNPHIYKNRYLVLEYYGPIKLSQLEKLSVEPTYNSINDEYYGEVWVCCGQVLRVELEPLEASFKIPYYVSIWEKDPSSVFGYGVPLMMADAQRVVTETWHMILDNSSISSGPQAAMQKHLVEPANGKWQFAPKQLWYLNDPQATIDQAIRFFNVPNVTQQLVPIMQLAQGFAEEESGIPLIAAGLQSPEVGDTATGQLVMRHASTTLLDFMSEEWDDNITAPLIEAFYAWNMQNNPKPEVKGVFTVDVRTSTEYKNKQLHIRDLEKLSVEASQNPEMAKWVNMDSLTRARLSMMNLPSRDIIKSVEQMTADEEERAKNQQPPPEMLKLELESRKIALEEASLEFEMQQQQQREAWEHDEKMAAVNARFVESQARVAVSQNEKETEMLKLAARSEEFASQLQSQEKIARENNLTKAFQAGLQQQVKAKDQQLYETELELKAQTGSGV